MRRRHVAAFAFVLAVGALICFVWLHDPATRPRPAAEPPAVSAPLPAAAVPRPDLDRTDLATPDPAAGAVADQPAGPGPTTGSLRVFVRDERGDALEGCRVAAGAQEAITGRSGTAEFVVAAARTFVAVDPPTGQPLVPRAGWQTVLADRHNDVVVVLSRQANTTFWCRLVAAEDERALPGVAVSSLPAETLLRSDAEGFVQTTVTDEQTYLEIRAAGRSPGRVVPTDGHATRATALRVPLPQGAVLHVHTTDTASAPVADVTIELRLHAWQVQWPHGARSRGDAICWRGATDAAGQLTFRDLPRGLPLDVTARCAAGRAAPAAQCWVLDAESEQRLLVLPLAGSVHGRVLDAAGQPVSGVSVQANVRDGERAPRVPDPAPDELRTTSAEDGTFRLAGLMPGAWQVGIPYDGAHRPNAVAVEVTPGRSVAIELLAEVGLTVAGRALAADDAPCRAVTINLHVDDTFVTSSVTDAQGRFRFAHLPAGACELRTDPFEGDIGLADPVTVVTGDEQVELHLHAVCGSLSGRLSGSDAWVTVYERGGDAVLGTRCDLDGSFTCRGLATGTWDVVAHDRSGRVALASAVQVLPGRATDNLALELRPAARLRPRHARADEFVVCQGQQIAGKDSLQQGAAGEAYVPPGTWTVAFRSLGREISRCEVTVAAGDERLVDGGR
ncbi:MAG: carboxypeptidase regulatory-like domain-containing protein [Planctomycetes bacterium]|nr:carboxypeptidase regulatory-like domain-containing protein [Planctomycetota bacterium]